MEGIGIVHGVYLTQEDYDKCLHSTRPGTDACPTCIARQVCKLTKNRED